MTRLFNFAISMAAGAAFGATAGTARAASEGGMPQLDPSVFSPQLVWLAITFAALYLIVARVAVPRIGGTIEMRRSRIANDIDQAASLKEETDKAIAEYEAALADARAKAHAIAQKNRDELNGEVDAERAKVEADIVAKTEKAEASIAATRDKALAEVRGVAADIAGDIVARLAGTKVSKAAVEKAVAQASGK